MTLASPLSPEALSRLPLPQKIEALALLPLAQELLQPRRPDQAADVSGENAIGAALHVRGPLLGCALVTAPLDRNNPWGAAHRGPRWLRSVTRHLTNVRLSAPRQWLRELAGTVDE